MSKTFFPVVVVLVLPLVAGALTFSLGSNQAEATYGGVAPAQEVRNRVSTLHREVQLLNLIKALELDEKQTIFILEKAREAKKLREEMLRSSLDDLERTAMVLEELKAVLMVGGNIPPDLRREWFSVHNKNKRLSEEYEERIRAVARSVEEVLEEHQLYVLETYVPCVIPPRGELAGQAQSRTIEEKLLARVRDMPDERFEALKDRIAERVIKRLVKHLPKGFKVSNVEEEKERIISVLVEARNMSDVEFELGKGRLVEKLVSKYEQPYSVDITTKIELFLLDPHIIPILEEKLGQL